MGDLLKVQFATVTNADTTVCTGASIASTVLSVSLCNTEAADDGTFDMRVRDGGSGDGYYIYKTQSLPSESTFIHNDKIILMTTDTLVVNSSSGQDIDIVVSYLEQT
jgi:hypothetical protein